MNIKSVYFTVLSSVFLLQSRLFASTSSEPLPWEGPLQQIVDSLSGPVVRGAAVASIVILGVTLAMGEGGGFFRKVIGIVFGLSIAVGATSFATSFFGISSGFTL